MTVLRSAGIFWTKEFLKAREQVLQLLRMMLLVSTRMHSLIRRTAAPRHHQVAMVMSRVSNADLGMPS